MSKSKIFNIIWMTFFITIWSSIVIAQAFEPISENVYQGIDVSEWQREIDFTQVVNSGIDIVYIKSSEGTTYIDPYFETNYEKAQSAGLKIGFYHYVLARTTEEAEAEANFFSSVISGKQADCKLAMDFENFGNLSNAEINQISEAFLNRVQELTEKEMIIYSDVSNAKNIFSIELASKYPLWVAEYGVRTPSNTNWNNWTGFQYTDTGEVAGIEGYVDRDEFAEEIFLEDSSKIKTNIKMTDNSTIIYTVKLGDTLSSIAARFDTSVSAIAKINNIQNPNLIFPNQVLVIRSGKVNDLNHILYTVQRGDTLTAIARRYGITISSIVKLNKISNPNLIYTGEILRILSKNVLEN